MTSLLDRCAGGSILEPPIELTKVEIDIDAATKLRQRIYDGLLPYQRAVVEDTEHRIVSFVAGYGAGKSRTMCAWAVLLCMDNPSELGVMFAPTGPLVRDVVIRSLEDFLEQYGIEYTYRASPLPEFTLHLPTGPATILCRSMENWTRIIGLNCAWICADEIDTSKVEIAQRAVDKFLGRLRAGQRRQLGLFSTPEGFGILHFLNVEQGHKPDRAMYRGRTADNPYLPPDFLEGMRENYSPALFQAYSEGIFCNLTQASVYPEFNRELNASEINALLESDTCYIGVDFNVSRCWLAVCIQRADGIHVIAEHIARDTPGVIETILDHYGAWVEHGQLIVCPDASSQSKSTKNAGISDFGLMKQAGLRMQTQASNPFIRDRVLTLNSLILNAKGERKLFVHPDCKGMIKGLEQQAFDQATQLPMKGDGGELDLSGQMDALGYAAWQLAGITAWGVRGHNRKNGSLVKRKVRVY
jgi:hypothetical protein